MGVESLQHTFLRCCDHQPQTQQQQQQYSRIGAQSASSSRAMLPAFMKSTLASTPTPTSAPEARCLRVAAVADSSALSAFGGWARSSSCGGSSVSRSSHYCQRHSSSICTNMNSSSSSRDEWSRGGFAVAGAAAAGSDARAVNNGPLQSVLEEEADRSQSRHSIDASVAAAAETSSSATAEEEDSTDSQVPAYLRKFKPPQYIWRAFAALVIAGQVVMRVMMGRVHWRNTLQQLEIVGPGSLGVSLLTACFVGMAFTIQFVKEFTRLGLTRSVGGVLGLALVRELSPVVTAIIMAGRVGSSFAAELGTMQVSEQTDTLRVLKTDPVDYLVTPRVLACCAALPVLTLLCFTVGLGASVFLADAVFSVSANVILDSAARALQTWDLISMMVKSVVFGGIIAEISCAWGMTTQGGAKGVGESTTSAVVISLVCVFIADFALSWLFFQGGPGDSLKAALG